jgi:hypothetical protein
MVIPANISQKADGKKPGFMTWNAGVEEVPGELPKRCMHLNFRDPKASFITDLEMLTSFF